jgi:hypothetical protein
VDGTHKRTQGQRTGDDRHPVGGGTIPADDLIIPELEEALQSRVRYRPWMPDEIAIVRKYWAPGMALAISRYITKSYPPGRSTTAVRQMVERLGLR